MRKRNVSMAFPTETITEGKVQVVVPKLKAFVKQPSDYAPSKAPVFYNPVMELNRDIAVLALQAYQKAANREISVCEPLTGSGIRGIRYATEVKGIRNVVIGDINEKAFRLARHNVQANKLNRRVTVKHEDAGSLLAHYSAPRKRFDAIDIDPFGSPAPYMDSSIRALRNNGLLALTGTDMAPLCGVHTKACIRKYGGKPLRTEYCHELAVRLLAGCLASTAAKYDIGIHLIFSHCTDHYIRTYATISYGAKKADEGISNMGYIWHCFNCFHREVRKELFPFKNLQECPECGSKLSLAGPLWTGEIFDKRFCELMEEEARRRTLKLSARIEKLLTTVKNEGDAPATYYVIDKICDKLNLPVPSVKKVAEMLIRASFRVSLTHFNTRGVRTDAPAERVKEIVQAAAAAV